MSSLIQIITIALCYFAFSVKGRNPYVEECYFLNSTTMNITLSAGPYMNGVDCNVEYGGFELNGVELPLYPQTQSWIAQASYGGMGSVSCDIDDTDVFCAGPPSVTVCCNGINDYTIQVDVTAAGNVYNCSILSGSTEQPIVFSSDSNTATNVVTTSNIQNGTLQCTYLSQNFTCYTPSPSNQAIFIPSILLLFSLSFVYLVI